MVPYKEAQRIVLRLAGALDPTRLPPSAAAGLVVAENVHAREAVPPFDSSAMDGYAVRAADTPGRLRVLDSLRAGKAPTRSLGAGAAMEIMTGAAVPPGADAVVMVERSRRDGDEVTVEVATIGEAIRPAGSDVRVGDAVVSAGCELTPAHVGVLASLGISRVLAHPRPRVGVLSTGDELRGADDVLQTGHIRDSNRPMLLSLIAESGFTAIDVGRVADDVDAITFSIREGLAQCDALITTGGVSVGTFDYVKRILAAVGHPAGVLTIAVKPSKPFAYAVVDGTPVLGLPGNPVSAAVSYELFARPLLRRLAGHPEARAFRAPLSAVAAEPIPRRRDGKVHFTRADVTVRDGRLVARPAGRQGPHQLSAMASTNGLAILPDGDGVQAEEELLVLLLREIHHTSPLESP